MFCNLHAFHPSWGTAALDIVGLLMKWGSSPSPFPLVPPLGSGLRGPHDGLEGTDDTWSPIQPRITHPHFWAWASVIWEVSGHFLLILVSEKQGLGSEHSSFCPSLAGRPVPSWVLVTCQSPPHHPQPSSFLKNPSTQGHPQPCSLLPWADSFPPGLCLSHPLETHP